MEVLREGERVVVRLGRPHRVVSTLPIPTLIDKVVFVQVGRDYSGCYLDTAVEVRRELGESTAVFLTAADLKKAFGVVEEGGLRLVGSVSLSPPSCVGTINLALFVDQPLSTWGLVDLLRTVAEAKCISVVNRFLKCSGRRSPGTVTDAILVGAPADVEETIHFAGFATEVGKRASRLVEKLITELDHFDLFERALGVSKREFVEAFAELLKKAPLSAAPEEALVELEKFLKDPNVWAMVLAASELDALGAAGAIPGLSREEYEKDTVRIVADELLGVSLADYLGGFNAVLTTYWVERVKKEGGFRELPMFSDDVFSALLAAVYLELYKRRV
ncbi:MAG: bifunctional adenosylcobinamide hydrolase/alpha-ribazole phosphatase CbiS [Pyrobaculum sp.]